jgi:hypothetical protein
MMSARGLRRGEAPEEIDMDPALDPEEQPVVTSGNQDEVRAGVTGHNVRYVLFASMALVVVLFVAIALMMR